MQEIIFPYHPDCKDPVIQAWMLRNSGVVDCPKLVEECAASVSNLTFVDQDGYDFVDPHGVTSENKTASISDVGDAKITNVCHFASDGSVNLKSSLRVQLYNPWRNKLHYLFIPQSSLANPMSVTIYKYKGVGFLKSRYNSDLDHLNSLQKWVVPSYVTLMNIPGNIGPQVLRSLQKRWVEEVPGFNWL